MFAISIGINNFTLFIYVVRMYTFIALSAGQTRFLLDIIIMYIFAQNGCMKSEDDITG